MDCIQKCLAGGGEQEGESEFGSLAYSPLTLADIRERQEWSKDTLHFTVGNPQKGPIHLRYNYLCQRGLYPDEPDKENQDAFKIIPAFAGEQTSIVMGVFDGHGEYGDDCSQFVRDNLEEKLLAARAEHGGDLEKAFRTAFRNINAEMHYAKVCEAPSTRRAQPRRPQLHGREANYAAETRLPAAERARATTHALTLHSSARSTVSVHVLDSAARGRTFPTRSLGRLPSSRTSIRAPCGLPTSATRVQSSASSRTGCSRRRRSRRIRLRLERTSASAYAQPVRFQCAHARYMHERLWPGAG